MEPAGAFPPGSTDIRRLKEQKNPGSANEMAALVAYYLAEVVPGTERKPAIEITDIEKYFKQANYKLPSKLKMTLVNATGPSTSLEGAHAQAKVLGNTRL